MVKRHGRPNSNADGGTYDDPTVENLLQNLAKRLAATNGKKQCGYLRYDIKEIIDRIVDELGNDERIAALYDLWYVAKENALTVYTEELPERVPLSQNKEFKSVENLVITEAMKLNLSADEIKETAEPTEPDYEPPDEEIESADMQTEDAAPPNKWQLCRMSKEHLDRDGDCCNPRKAVEYPTQSAKQGYIRSQQEDCNRKLQYRFQRYR